PPALRPVMPELLIEPLQPANDALLRRVGVDQARLHALAVQLERTGIAACGGGSRQSGSRGGKIDGHCRQEIREQKRGPERPRPPVYFSRATERNGIRASL